LARTSLEDELEDRLGLKAGTLDHLKAEQSDWARVIKSHAIVEATLNVRLARRFPDLAEIVTRLPFDHGTYGKLALLDQVGWLTAHELRLLRALHELRSVLVHDVTFLDFDLEEKTDRWTAEKRRRFVDVIFEFWQASNRLNLNEEWTEAHKANPAFMVTSAAWRFVMDTDNLLLREGRAKRGA
jgi:hypothetical protein